MTRMAPPNPSLRVYDSRGWTQRFQDDYAAILERDPFAEERDASWCRRPARTPRERLEQRAQEYIDHPEVGRIYLCQPVATVPSARLRAFRLRERIVRHGAVVVYEWPAGKTDASGFLEAVQSIL